VKKHKDILESLQLAAQGKKGITIIGSKGNEKIITYSKLLKKSRKLCTFLSTQKIERSNFVLIYCHEIENFMYAFWACVAGGFIAVPVSTSVQSDMKAALKHNMNFSCVISDDVEEEVFQDIQVKINLSTFTWEKNTDSMCVRNKYCEDDIMYILHSSGTTGSPKGIPVSRGNVIANLVDEIEIFDVRSDDIVLNWAALTHSGGLVLFHLMAIVKGIHQYYLSDKIYVENPLLWMDIISQYNVTIAGSVPFALTHFLNFYYSSNRDFKWNLVNLKVITLGAEHVNTDLFVSFNNEMSKYGLRLGVLTPTYGLTEATCVFGYAMNNGKLDTYATEQKQLIFGDKIVKMSRLCNNQGYIVVLCQENGEIKPRNSIN